ncbi:GNAT family N-acetyltransferase [Microbacterium sp. NPDC088619]|uniref:GNAT family N-acetyltransferase n=1 Tax=Microbacterium sp. NPDC088619 TaxID=3364196 RepID=UPI0037FBCD01
MEIRSLDVSDDRAMRSAYFVETAANEHARPGWRGAGADARTLGWRADDGWTTRLLGAWDDERLVGFGASVTHDSVPDTAWIFAWVLPDLQHRGIGSALVRAAEEQSPPVVARFVARAYRPTRDAISTLARGFLEPLGFASATTETVVELDLRAVSLPEQSAVAGYTVTSHIDGVPEGLREEVGRIKGLVDAEAPNGELAWLESPVTAAEYLEEIELWNAQGSTAVETVAVDASGEVAAWTCLVTSETQGGHARIEGTLVLKDHRGHALGAAVKLANLQTARALHGVGRVRTSTDDQNIWMRSINSMLGFVPVEFEAIFQRTVNPG